MTTVYHEGKPVYDIITTWDGGVPKSNWVRHHTVDIGKRIAGELAKEYDREKRFNMHRTHIARYKREYLETACVFLAKAGYNAEVECHDIKESHHNTITIRR